jgi:hypothetical protein
VFPRCATYGSWPRKAEFWFYESGARFQATDSGSKIATFANAVINNDYARKIAVKTHAAMKMKSSLGYVMGGRTFGYGATSMSPQYDDEGNPIFEVNPEADHITFTNEQWRIIPPDVAAALDQRFTANKAKGTGVGAHTTKGAAPRYPLSGGLVKCPTCGGNFEASRGFYECAVHRRKGSAICANKLRLKITELDEAVSRLLDGQVLTAAFIARIIRLADASPDDGRTRLESDRVKLKASIDFARREDDRNLPVAHQGNSVSRRSTS